MMSRVQHENLVKFIGACKDPFMVIATELLPGMSLKKYLSSIRPKQVDLHKAISFALDIARAMDCLHANGIIHRDLKPDNLLLTANQKNVKLIDFGLAREETVTEMMTAETGTYRWMAPELYSTVTLRRGEKKHYTNKVDVYSFGIVLWELLTNRMPFEGMSNLQAAYAAAFKQMRPPLPEDTPPELVFIVQSCWVEDPSTRPSFSQIIRMLNAFLYTLPSAPSPEPDAVPAVMNTRGAITATSSPRRGGKLSFLRQLFAAKKAGIYAFSSNDIKVGSNIEVDGAPWRVLEFLHVKPGKGAAFVRTKVRNYITGNTVEKTFRAGSTIQEANIAKETKQFTYKDGSQFVFMDLATYEETRLTEAEVGEKTKWLKEGMDCNVVFWNGRVIDFELPIIVKLTVVEVDPGVRGDTAQGGSKPATLDTGAVINVPLFVNTGEEILVDTRTGQYTNRA